MKKIIFAAIFISGAAYASNDSLTHQLIPVEDSVANVAINLDFGAERPLVEAVHMDLAALCKDQNMTAPQMLMSDEKICAFHNYEFDKDSKVLSLYYSTGEVKDEVTSCETHWKQEINLKEVCDGGASLETVSWRRHYGYHRGVRRRYRVRAVPAPYGQYTPEQNIGANIFGGIFGGYPEQQPQAQPAYPTYPSPYQQVPRSGMRYGRGGYPRNGRGEVVRCPGLGGGECLSAIIAAESGCNAGIRHAGHGIGLCAIENDGRRLRFGPACANIGSVAGQLRCCAAMVAQGGMSYFGPRTRRIARGACGR